MKLLVRRVCIAVAAACSLLGASAHRAGAQPLPPLSWSAPAFVDHQPPYASPAPAAGQTPLSAVSCPNASLCVAGDARGDILTSSDPAAGPGSWRIARVDDKLIVGPFDEGIVALACPSASLCVGADGSGDVLTSTNPSGGASAWKLTPLESGHSPAPLALASGLTSISCPSVSFCVAADRRGDALASTDPTGGASKWRSVNVDPKPGILGITSVSCPTRSFCVAVDSSGNVVTSTDPTGGASAWKLHAVYGSSALYGVSCASTSLCVAVDGTAVVVSTDPTGGSSTWQRATVEQGDLYRLNAVSCPSASMCVAVDQEGNVVTSTDPAGGASAWEINAAEYVPFGPGIPGLSGLFAVSCPSTSFCLSVDSLGNAVRSANPTGGAGAWTVEQIDGSNGPDGLACRSSGCVAVDQSGNVLSSTDPTDASRWAIQRADDTGQGSNGSTLGVVSCPASTFCAAVDGDGNVLSSRTPFGGFGWSVTAADPGNLLSSVSCPSESLCVAVDMSGNAVTSTDPATASPTWTVSNVDRDLTPGGAQAELEDVSCPSVSLCVAVDSAGNALTSTNPTGGSAAWTANDVAGTTALSAVACPTASMCVAAGTAAIAVSKAPTAGVQAWSTSSIDYALTRISCSSASFCVAVDQSGDVVTSTDPAGGGTAWAGGHIEPDYVGAISCSLPSACVALDDMGGLSIGRPPTVRQLLASPLRGAVSPPAAARRIKSLLVRGGYSFSFSAPVRGRLVVTWRLRGRDVLLARAATTFGGARTRQVRLALTNAGKSLLAHSRRASVIARADFTPAAGASVATARGFSIA